MEAAKAFFASVLPRLLNFSTWRESHHPEDPRRTWRYYHRETFHGDDAAFSQLEELADRCHLRVIRKKDRPLVVFGVFSNDRVSHEMLVGAILLGFCDGDTYKEREYAASVGLCPAPRRDCAHCGGVVDDLHTLTIHHDDWWCDTCVLRYLDHGW